MPQASPSSEEPTQYLQPQPQSTQQDQPGRHEQAQGSAVRSDTIDEDDLSMAPTQILTPTQRIEYLTRHWQQEMLRKEGQVGIPDESSGSQEQSQQELAGPAQGTGSEPRTGSAQGTIPTDAPTIIAATGGSPAQSIKEVTEVSQAQSSQRHDQNGEELSATEKIESEEPELAVSLEEEKTMNDNKQSTNTEEATESTEQQTEHSFPVLSGGTKINDRYEVVQVIKSEQDEHIYEVLDHKGYLHCWFCNSTDNTEGADFCENCGVQLLKAYLMHEYPAAGKGAPSEESVLQAGIVDTIMENGNTYVIELPQTEQNAFPLGAQVLAACASDAGNLRRADPNEDSAMVLLLQRVHESLASPAGIFLVADGLGGHSNGQYASRLAVNVIVERSVRDLLLSPLSAEREGEGTKQWDEESILELLQDAIEDANAAICQVNQRDKTDMGCTLTGFLISGERAYIFNVGDSRTYILRDEKIYQLTKDHSLVGQLVEGGLIEPDDVYNHPQRSQIYRSIGDKLNVQIDFFKQQIHPGDILLSCSDGLWEMVRDPQITEILNAAPDPQTASMQLIEAANANGGEDNVSAVVVFVR
jgi:serine/threonine protein phosphatase PrpC